VAGAAVVFLGIRSENALVAVLVVTMRRQAKVHVVFNFLAADVATESLAAWALHSVAALHFKEAFLTSRAFADDGGCHFIGDAVPLVGLALLFFLRLDLLAGFVHVRRLAALVAIRVVALRTLNERLVWRECSDDGAVWALTGIVHARLDQTGSHHVFVDALSHGGIGNRLVEGTIRKASFAIFFHAQALDLKLSLAEDVFFRVRSETVQTEQMSIVALAHVVEREIEVAAATLDHQLVFDTVLSVFVLFFVLFAVVLLFFSVIPRFLFGIQLWNVVDLVQ